MTNDARWHTWSQSYGECSRVLYGALMPSNSSKRRQPSSRRPPGGTVTQLVQPVSPQLRFAFTECHADGHQWKHQGRVGAPDYSAPEGFGNAIGRLSVCTSCGSERVRWYTRSGDVVNRYKYRDGYAHKRSGVDDIAPSRLEWRQQLVISLFDDAKPKSKRAAS